MILIQITLILIGGEGIPGSDVKFEIQRAANTDTSAFTFPNDIYWQPQLIF